MGVNFSKKSTSQQHQTISDKLLSQETAAARAPIGNDRNPFARQVRSDLTHQSPVSITNASFCPTSVSEKWAPNDDGDSDYNDEGRHYASEYECTVCVRTFSTQQSLTQHCQTTGHDEDWADDDAGEYWCPKTSDGEDFTDSSGSSNRDWSGSTGEEGSDDDEEDSEDEDAGDFDSSGSWNANEEYYEDKHNLRRGSFAQQRQYDVSLFECSICKKTFRTQRSLSQHCEDTGHIEDSQDDDGDEIETPEPPVDSPGQWVLREDFTGRKSFGYFVCGCGRFWLSAHAFKDYRQGCRGCEQKSFPYFLWENFGKRTDRDRNYADDKPHDASRCEACRNGVCIRGVTARVARVNLAQDLGHSDYDDAEYYDSYYSD